MFKNFFKFEKSGYPIIPVAFYCVIIFSLISILLIMKNNYTKSDIKNYISPVESVVMNIEMKNYITSNVFVCYDDFCSPLENNALSKIYYSKFQPGNENVDNKKIKNIILAYPVKDKQFYDNVNYVDLYIGNKKYYFDKNELSKIQQKEMNVEVSNSIDKKKEIVKYNTILISDKGNYRGIYNNICSLFLSLFYNWKIFIIPYLWLFFAYVFYLFNKDEIKYNLKFPKIKPIYILSFITVIGLLLRLDNIAYYPLWTDEVYTKTVAIKDFISCFKDAGNPPLFFILEYLISKIIGTSDFALRFLPLIFGVLTVSCVYFLFNKINTKLALFTSFMASINTILIYHSQEARGYSLSALLIVLSIYYLFEYLKNPTAKKLVIYTIAAILCVNQNYYLIIFVFTNFIWGLVDLLSKKQPKLLLKFSLANFIAAISFIPYLFISFNNAIKSGFNGWIPPLSKELFKYAINEFFTNKYIFLFLCAVLLVNLLLVILPENILIKINFKTNPAKNNLLIYLVYSLALILIIVSLISIFVKPIFHKRILLSIYMLLFMVEIINIAGVVEFIKENIVIKISKLSYFLILTAACFLITHPMPIRAQCRLDDFMHILQFDAAKYEKDYEIHAITCDTQEYLEHYPEIKNLNIKWHYINTNSGFYLKNINKFDYIDKNKKSVLYFHGIASDISEIYVFHPNIDIFKSNSISTAKIKYEPKN